MHQGLTALVIESHETVAPIIIDVLKRAGVSRTVVVPSCAAALNSEVGFGMALVDLRDWIRGTEDFETFAKRSRSYGTVVGLMASTIDRAVIGAARTAPCQFVVLKPFGPDELRHKLSSYLVLPRKPTMNATPQKVPSVSVPGLREPVAVVDNIAFL